ncbi:hypothetical protein [Acinetobacter junii]|uniref:hypothetical protein n=1 Tax=Acinetobacter junii TaxID=40215 RepID=UPI00124F229E|nr:hypothetical protein [Acinetobacter junii]
MLYKIASPIIQPRMRFFDADGKPLVGGKVYSYKVGTEIFKPTYRDAQRTALNQNPVVLDNEGSALIYLLGSHVLKIYDKKGNFIEQIYVPEAQMTTQFFDKFGKPLSFGRVWTYDIASTIKKTSFANADQSQPNPNPIILDVEGKASISMIGSYRLRTYNEKNVHLGDQDFQRPVAQALTSKPYPLYFDEKISSNVSISEKITLRTVLKSTSINDELIEGIEFNDFMLRSVLRGFEAKDFIENSVSFSDFTLRSVLQEFHIEPERISSSLNFSNFSLAQKLITTTLPPEQVTSSVSFGNIILN